MTFAIAAFCAKSGKTGFCQTTSTPAVGSKAGRLVPGHGVAVVQAKISHNTLEAACRLLGAGRSAQDILAELPQHDSNFDWRQVAIVRQGQVALFSTTHAREWFGAVQGADFAAFGNYVKGPQVVQAVADAFKASAGLELEERLLRAIEAGRDAGGENFGQHSAVIAVGDTSPVPLLDLRVDMNPEPVAELRRLFDWYKPLIPYYVRRNSDPTVPPWRDYLGAQGHPLAPWLKVGQTAEGVTS